MVLHESAATGLWRHSLYAADSTIIDNFNSQVVKRPEKIAVICGDRRLSYAQLAELSQRIAASLVAAGVGKGDRVAILSGRSIEAVAAQLGVLTIGAAFVPLDPASPGAVQSGILDAAGVHVILTHGDAAADAGKGRHIIDLQAIPAAPADLVWPQGPGPEDLAYVIFTSGSTGEPKGVMVPHRGVCRLVRGQDYAGFGPDQVILCMAAVGFDAIVIETYGAIMNGGTLVILPDAAPSLDRIEAAIRDHGVTFAFITAGLFHIVAEHRPALLAPLRQVCSCGDVLSETHVAQIRRRLPQLRLINGYGPAENTVATCFHTIGDDWTGGPVPIGRPLAHDRVFILDEDLRPLGPGEVGQIAVGGAGIALGYLGRPDVTAASFVHFEADGFSGKVYLTGDLAEMRHDGVLMFHGRMDRQVKINGQRVELDAVEHALRADPAVEDAAVVARARPDGSREILGFVKPQTAAGAEGQVAPILSRLRTTLPAAAVPSQLMIRDAFPLSASGKVDRKRLAAEVEAMQQPSAPPTAEGIGAIIRATWAEVLGRPAEPADRTFFDLGGTSLQLIAVHARLQQRLGRSFDIARLFEAPRIRDLEVLIAGAAPDPTAPAAALDPVAASRVRMSRARARRGALQ